MRVVLRADASSWIGTGHVRRCATLADELQRRGAACTVLTRTMPGDAVAWLRGRGLAVRTLTPTAGPSAPVDPDAPAHESWLGVPLEQELAESTAALRDLAGEDGLDLLVVDHYGLDARWEAAARPYAHRIAAIDDLADRPHQADVLLDQNLWSAPEDRYADLVPRSSTTLVGPRYALLAADYPALRDRVAPRCGPVRRVLVSFGGADEVLTRQAIRVLPDALPGGVAVDLVLAGAPAVRAELAGHARAAGFTVHEDVPSLAPLLARADLAIGAGGVTTWERCALRLPALIVTVAENQHPIARELEATGAATWLGPAEAVDDGRLRDAVREAVAATDLEVRSRAAGAQTDGAGTRRVAAALLAPMQRRLTTRPTTLADLDELGALSVAGAGPDEQAPERPVLEDALRDGARHRVHTLLDPAGVPLGLALACRGPAAWTLQVATRRGWHVSPAALFAAAAERLPGRCESPAGADAPPATPVVASRPEAAPSATGLRLTVCSGAGSWMDDHLPALLGDWLRQGHHVTWVHEASRIPPSDVCFLLSYGRMVGRDVRARSSQTVVVHASDLPRGRGWSPLTWQILEGASRVPICVFEAADDVDSGPVYLRSEVRFGGHELLDELRHDLAEEIVRLCARFVTDRDRLVAAARPQAGTPSTYPRRRPADSRVDPDRPLAEQFDLLRVVDGHRYPAWFELRGHRYTLTIHPGSPAQDTARGADHPRGGAHREDR